MVVEGTHMCAMMRGVKKSQTNMTTRKMLGLFGDGHLAAALEAPGFDALDRRQSQGNLLGG